MKKRVINFFKKPFIRNVIILSSGTAGAQLITMSLAPFITRIYGPEAYGIMGTFTAFITMIGPVAALTYPIAIVLPKKNSEAKGLIKLSLLIALIVAIVVTILILLFKEYFILLFSLEEVSAFIYFIPFVLILSSFMQVTEQWLIRQKQFGVSAKATFLQSMIVNGSKVGIGLLYPFASILIIFSSLRPGINAFFMLFFTRKDNEKLLTSSIQERVSLKSLAKKYNDFPIFRAPEMFLSSVSGNFPIILLTMFFGPASAGFYTIGKTVLNLPTTLLSKSIGDVFYPRISEAANNKENITSLITKATLALVGIGAIPYGFVVIFGPWLFGLVFGESWVTAGEYARWIALWSYLSFVNRPSVRAFPVLSAQRFHLIYTIFTLIVRISALLIGFIVFKSDLLAIALFGISGAILNIGLIFMSLIISKKFDSSNKKYA